MTKSFKIGGIHPPESKLTAGCAITPLSLPAEITLALSQHIGAPAKAVVKKGDRVLRGQLLAAPASFVSAPVHSPVSGVVKKIDTAKTPQGYPVEAVTIAVDGTECVELTPQSDIVKAVADAGIVGMGGAAFPTPVKLTPPADTKIDTIVINAAECEPFLTCDHALMLSDADGVIDGARLLMEAAGVKRCIIGVEANKPDAIKLLRRKVADVNGIEVVALKPRYPQGGEKQLIEALTGRRVPSGALPAAVGVIVQNVATARAVSRAVRLGEPLMERVVTVTGPAVSRPGNFLVPFGTPLRALIEAAGGLPANTGKIIAGGPMMGRAVANLDSFTVKGLSGLLILPEAMAGREAPGPCIRCARCVAGCPMGLEPYLLANYAGRRMTDEMLAARIADCIECGSCSYVCPASRPLLDLIRVGKQQSLKRK